MCHPRIPSDKAVREDRKLRAAEMLSDLMLRELGHGPAPADLVRFFGEKWDRVSTLAHSIHDGSYAYAEPAPTPSNASPYQNLTDPTGLFRGDPYGML